MLIGYSLEYNQHKFHKLNSIISFSLCVNLNKSDDFTVVLFQIKSVSGLLFVWPVRHKQCNINLMLIK